jgi:catechol-2,3-dioxygenase
VSQWVDDIDHVEVIVRNMDAAVAWYQRVLGLKEIARWNPEPVMMAAGATKVALHCTTPLRDDHTGWRIAWRVSAERFEHTQTHLRSCGVDFRGPIDHDTSLSIYFEDCEGNPLEITTYPDRDS